MKAWVPSERKRVAGLIVQMRAHGQQQIAQLRAQTAELIKSERDQLGKRIRAARAAAKLGKCVDMTAGPQIALYAYPKKPPHLKRGGQQRLFSTAPTHGGGKLGAPFRVRGELIGSEKAAHASVLRHLKQDQGGIVVLELADGAGGYVDGPYFGLEGEGKQATLRELDPLDPHGHTAGRAQKHERYGSGLRSVLPSTKPPPKRSSAPPAAKAAAADRRSNTKTAKRKSTRPPSNPTHREIGSPATNGAAKLLAKARPDGAASFGNRFHVYFVANGDENLIGRRKTQAGAEQLAAHLAFKHRQPTIHGWYVQPAKRGAGMVRSSSYDLKSPHFRIEG